ncbi:MAG: hypothetical protein U0892_19445 [Pirellulales bacterium]
METQLHYQLKQAYASTADQTEVTVGSYRIDAVAKNGELIEIQHASLGALRDKTRKLLASEEQYRLRIVKPIIARKWIVTLDADTMLPLRRRMSPKRGEVMDVFMDLVHFAKLFPHPRLALDVVLVDAEEIRTPKLKHRFRRKNYIIEEQRLLDIIETVSLKRSTDLYRLMPKLKLPKQFDSGMLAEQIGRPRWFAQKVAYCLMHCGVVDEAGKSGNSRLYRRTSARRAA